MSDNVGYVRGSAGRRKADGKRMTILFDGTISDNNWVEFKECLKALACNYGLKIYEEEGPVAKNDCDTLKKEVKCSTKGSSA